MKKFNRRYVIVIVGVLCVCILGYAGYKYTSFQHDSKQYIVDIEEAYQNYETIKVEEDYNKKLEQLSKLIAVKTDKNVNKKSNTYYIEKVTQAKSELISYFESELKTQTLDELDKIMDKNKITKVKKELEELKSKINNEKLKELSVFKDDKEKEEFVNSIESLVKKYDQRLKFIKEKEAEEKKKAEEEAKKLAEEKAKAEEEARKLAQQQAAANNQTSNNNNSGNNNNVNSSNQQSQNNSQSSNNSNNSNNESQSSTDSWKKPWFQYHWQYDLKTGETIPGTEFWYDPRTDKMYDLDGNFIGTGTF